MHNFEAKERRMTEFIQTIFSGQINSFGHFYNYPNPPKVGDIDMLTISSVSESFSINSENPLFNPLNKEFTGFFTR